MLDVLGPIDVLEPGVFQEDPLDERAHDGDIHVLVDRGREEEAPVLAIVRRQVGPAAAQRDPEGTARDDHRRSTAAPKSYPDCRWIASTMTSAARASARPGDGSRSSRMS